MKIIIKFFFNLHFVKPWFECHSVAKLLITFVVFGWTFFLLSESDGATVKAQSRNIKEQNKNQEIILKKIITNFCLLAKKGKFPKLDDLITKYEYDFPINQEESQIPKNSAMVEYDYKILKKEIPELIYKQQLFIDTLRINWIKNSEASVCVNFGFKYEKSRFMGSNFYLVRDNTLKMWKIAQIEIKPSTSTKCGDSP